MKKIVLLFAMLLTFSSSFISCRETANEQTEEELNNDDLDVDDDLDETDTEVPREEGVGEIEDDL